MVGVFSLGLAVAAPIALFCNLKLSAVITTDAKFEYNSSDYFTLRSLMSVFTLTIILGIAWIGTHPREVGWVLTLIGIAKTSDAISDIVYGYLLRFERMSLVAASRILHAILQLNAMGIVLYLTGNLVLTVLAWALAGCFVTCAYDVYILRKTQANSGRNEEWWRLRDRWNKVWGLAKMTLPLGLATMVGALLTNAPRYLIQEHAGAKELGIFSAISALMMAGTTVIAAMGGSASPRLALYHAEGRYAEYDRLVLHLVVAGILLGAMGWLFAVTFGSEILGVLYASEYAARRDVLVWLMIASWLNFAYVFLGTGIQGMREFRFDLPIQTICLVLIVGLSYVLVRSHGILGAAWAGAITNVCACLIYAMVFTMIRARKRNLRLA